MPAAASSFSSSAARRLADNSTSHPSPVCSLGPAGLPFRRGFSLSTPPPPPGFSFQPLSHGPPPSRLIAPQRRSPQGRRPRTAPLPPPPSLSSDLPSFNCAGAQLGARPLCFVSGDTSLTLTLRRCPMGPCLW